MHGCHRLGSCCCVWLAIWRHKRRRAAIPRGTGLSRFYSLDYAGTVKSYQKEVGAFLIWLEALACQPELPEEYGDFLCAYLFNFQTGLYRTSQPRGALAGG